MLITERDVDHIFERVLSWTCVSSPITGSYSIPGRLLPETETDAHQFLGSHSISP